MIRRDQELETLRRLLSQHPVVGIVGARQVGKTTLAHSLVVRTKGPSSIFDLENPEDLARLGDPMLALKELKGLVVIDEIQRYPGLFPVLRVLVDRPKPPARFLVLGSASPDLLRQSSETLAGRIVYHELGGFSLDEVGAKNHMRLWLRGGFPRSYLARSHAESDAWRQGFVRTFLERDLPQLGITIGSTTLRRFWSMLAHYHGQIWNGSEFARSFGVADTTIRNYLDLLTSALVVRQLQPWHENISKRQVKAPKVYLADSGLLHALLNLKTLKDLEGHPKVGASWEGFALDSVVHQLRARPIAQKTLAMYVRRAKVERHGEERGGGGVIMSEIPAGEVSGHGADDGWAHRSYDWLRDRDVAYPRDHPPGSVPLSVAAGLPGRSAVRRRRWAGQRRPRRSRPD